MTPHGKGYSHISNLISQNLIRERVLLQLGSSHPAHLVDGLPDPLVRCTSVIRHLAAQTHTYAMLILWCVSAYMCRVASANCCFVLSSRPSKPSAERCVTKDERSMFTLTFMLGRLRKVEVMS